MNCITKPWKDMEESLYFIKWREASLKGYMLLYYTIKFWLSYILKKNKIMERMKWSVVARSYGEEKIKRESTQDLGGRGSGYRHYLFSQPQRFYNSKSEPLVNYELWAIMMCQCMFISSNKYTTLVGNVENGRDCIGVEAGKIQEVSLLSTQIC